MNDHEIMQKCRKKWVQEFRRSGLEKPDIKMMASYHRGFIDALNVALDIAIKESCEPQKEKS